MRAFVTATGTDIGKTYVACGLVRELRMAGAATLALKPVVSGFDAARAGDSDPARLLAAQHRAVDDAGIGAVSPWRFAAPLSPDRAAALEGRRIDYEAVLAFCRAGLARPGSVLIEGIGGVMVPLDGTRTVLDLMADLRLPVVLVGGSYLGAISHGLTALAVLRARGLRCVVAMSESLEGPDPEPSAAAIARHGGVSVIRLGRTAPGLHDPAFARLAGAVEGQADGG